jgi:hypothetical protein
VGFLCPATVEQSHRLRDKPSESGVLSRDERLLRELEEDDDRDLDLTRDGTGRTHGEALAQFHRMYGARPSQDGPPRLVPPPALVQWAFGAEVTACICSTTCSSGQGSVNCTTV